MHMTVNLFLFRKSWSRFINSEMEIASVLVSDCVVLLEARSVFH